MWSFLIPNVRWKWDPAQGVPTKKVLKAQRQAIRSGSIDVKRRVLEHIVELADRHDQFQDVFCQYKVTADVCMCFLSGPVTVQIAAANALAALCDDHPGNCAAVLAAHHSNKKPLPLAVKLLEHKDIDLALAAAGLLDVLAASDSSSVLQHLNQASCIEDLLKRMRSWSRKALTATEPLAPSYLKLLRRLLRVLQSVATTVGLAMCRELFKARVVGLLLELVQEHRGRQLADGSSEGGSLTGHPAVVRDALYLLFIVLSRIPAHRVKLQEAEGVQRLLGVLRDLNLPWSVRSQAVAVLTAAAASPAVAEDVRTRGLDVVVMMVNAFASGRPVQGAPGSSTTPSRAAGLTSGPFSPSPPPSPADSVGVSPMPGSVAAGTADAEPRTAVVVEQLLGLLDAVVRAGPSAEFMEERRVGVLLTALNSGLASFAGPGYRVATAAAQVLFRLACCPGIPLSPSLRGTTASLTKLVMRAQDSDAAATARDAQVLHGAWCAVGLVSKILGDDQQHGTMQQEQVLSGGVLQVMVRFLEVSAPAVLVAVGAAPPPYDAAAAATSIWQTPGIQLGDGMRPDGRAYLAKERVVSDLRDTVPLLLQLLWNLAQRAANVHALKEMGVVAAVTKLQTWPHVQWRVKRLLHLLGERDLEYKPFSAYGCGPLFEMVLRSLQLDPRPFLDQGVDPPVLLQLEDSSLRRDLGLNETGVLKVARIRDASTLFTAIDAVDGKVDGCITTADVEKYLTSVCSLKQREAQAICDDTFKELQLLPGEPLSFLQFLGVYPVLAAVLEPVMPKQDQGQRSNAAGAAGAATAVANDSFSARLWKRQRVGGT